MRPPSRSRPPSRRRRRSTTAPRRTGRARSRPATARSRAAAPRTRRTRAHVAVGASEGARCAPRALLQHVGRTLPRVDEDLHHGPRLPARHLAPADAELERAVGLEPLEQPAARLLCRPRAPPAGAPPPSRHRSARCRAPPWRGSRAAPPGRTRSARRRRRRRPGAEPVLRVDVGGSQGEDLGDQIEQKVGLVVGPLLRAAQQAERRAEDAHAGRAVLVRLGRLGEEGCRRRQVGEGRVGDAEPCLRRKASRMNLASCGRSRLRLSLARSSCRRPAPR